MLLVKAHLSVLVLLRNINSHLQQEKSQHDCQRLSGEMSLSLAPQTGEATDASKKCEI
jgi:hypothetical protein